MEQFEHIRSVPAPILSRDRTVEFYVHRESKLLVVIYSHPSTLTSLDVVVPFEANDQRGCVV